MKSISAFRKFNTIAAAAVIVMSMLLGMSQSASAAPARCCVYVWSGAEARTSPNTSYSVFGRVTPDPGFNPFGTQKSLVQCYADGAWYTGSYSSNRWFLVYVSTTTLRTGWYYVHSSYVDRQLQVPRC